MIIIVRKIYPNLVRGNILNIEVKQNVSFEIYNIFKKRNLEGNVTPTNKDFNVSRLNKGVYILKPTSLNGSVSKKLIFKDKLFSNNTAKGNSKKNRLFLWLITT